MSCELGLTLMAGEVDNERTAYRLKLDLRGVAVMVNVNVEIRVSDSPVKDALNQYYEFLYTMLNPSAKQKVALNSTLVTFDILPKAPEFTNYVFRAFADRTVTLSPTAISPVALGVANTNDRYSAKYLEMLRLAIFKLDWSLSTADKDKIDLLKRENKKLTKELQDLYTSMFDKWSSHAAHIGLKEDDPYYLDKQTAYFNTMRFASQISEISGEIGENVVAMRDIRDAAYPDADARRLALLHQFGTLEEGKMALPKSPRLEEVNNYDPIKLGQAYIYNNLNYFEATAEVRPSGDLPNFLIRKGFRDFEISKEATATHQHDQAWSGSASAQYWFWKASTNANYERHLKETIAATNKIHVSFENIAEYWVNRGPWYASDVFDSPRVQKVLADNPRLAALLAYSISSVVIGRGTALTLKFTQESTFSEWSKFSSSASGSFSVLGLDIPIGSGSYSDYELHTATAGDKKSVTFLDDPDHVRLLGFRVDKMFDGAESFVHANHPFIDEVISDLPKQIMKGVPLDKLKSEMLLRGTHQLTAKSSKPQSNRKPR